MRAIRLDQPLTLDGILDEPVYENVSPVNGFIQQEPNEGARATEDTDLWVLFDDKQVFIAARCWDSRPELIMAKRDATRQSRFVSRTTTSPWFLIPSTIAVTPLSSTPTPSAA